LNSGDQSNDRAANEFYRYLTDPKAGRFANDHVRLLTNDGATQQNIINTLGPSWLGRVADKDDLVVVFISTNAFPTTDGGAYLSAYNCELDNIYSTCISMKRLMQDLKNTCKSDRVILVLQATASGNAELSSVAMQGSKSLSKSYNVDVGTLMLGKGYTILSSSSFDQPTFGDTFSKNLVAALRSKDGLIPLNEAFDQAKARTATQTEQQMKLQTPQLKTTWTGNDIIIGAPPLDKVSNVPADATLFLGAESHYLNGSRAAASNDLDGAIAEYKLAIAADPTYADAVEDYGSALALKEQWQPAGEQLLRAIALRPQDALYRTNYARVLDQLGQKEECIMQLEYAYSLNPKDAVVLKALASKAMSTGDTNSAEHLLGEALALYPNSAELHEKLAYAQTRAGKIDDALVHANQSVTLNPSSATARLNLGSILLAKQDVNKAIDCFSQVAAQNPGNCDALYLLGQAYLLSGKSSQARATLSKFVGACTPDDPRLADCKKRLSEMTTSN
jgi:tetratricopeptide (TPR) repeat protein